MRVGTVTFGDEDTELISPQARNDVTCPGNVTQCSARAHDERIACRVPEGAGRVRLEVFDLTGRRVAVPLDAPLAAGTHTVAWNGADAGGRRLANGVYLVRLDAGGRRETRRIVLAD